MVRIPAMYNTIRAADIKDKASGHKPFTGDLMIEQIRTEILINTVSRMVSQICISILYKASYLRSNKNLRKNKCRFSVI